MKGAERRMMIFQTLKTAGKPVSGNTFAKQFGVSRQVIVQDIALLRAEGNDIVSTSSGYLLSEQFQASRVFKVHHDDASIEKELTMMVDLGETLFFAAGSDKNIKLTSKDDLELFKAYLKMEHDY